MPNVMANPAFRRAAAALSHPVTLAAIVVMLLNDHVFKAAWPAWWTGKLSDVAWVVFAPLVLAAVVSLLVPARWRHQERAVIGLALLVTGISYVLFNAWSPFHGLIVWMFHNLFGWDSGVTRDPTDALSLAALAVSWWIWWRPVDRAAFHYKALAVSSLAALATIATSPPERDRGITCLFQDGARVISVARSNYHELATFQSADGGLTWSKVNEPLTTHCIGQPYRYFTMGTSEFRVLPGIGVERSDDGYQTWVMDLDLKSLHHEARSLYYQSYGNPAPRDWMVDPASGNLVLAMGLDGTAVRIERGEWQWSTVGPYRLKPTIAMRYLSLLNAELALGTTLVVISFATALYAARARGWSYLPVLVLAWLWWFFNWSRFPDVHNPASLFLEPNPGWLLAVLLPPAFSGGLTTIVGIAFESDGPGLVVLLLVMACITLPLAALSLVSPLVITFSGVAVVTGFGYAIYRHEQRRLWMILGSSIAQLGLFMLPLALWTQGQIGSYRLAIICSLALGVTAALSQVLWVRRAGAKGSVPPADHTVNH